MGFLDKFKKKSADEKILKDEAGQKEEKPKKIDIKESKVKTEENDKKEVKKPGTSEGDIKGKTSQSYRILIKPLITEKAGDLGAINKYVFAVNPRMNKVEVKKAIRTIYKVEPVKISISNFSGKNVKYGRIRGKTKNWKKAIITLKEGDKIEVYEGV